MLNKLTQFEGLMVQAKAIIFIKLSNEAFCKAYLIECYRRLVSIYRLDQFMHI